MKISLDEYSTVIFDVDGTLYYISPVKFLIGIDMIVYLILHPSFINDMRIINEFRRIRKENSWKRESLQKQIQTVARKHDLTYDSCYKLISRWMFERPSKYVYLFRNKAVTRLFHRCRENGINTVIYSDYPPMAKLDALNIHPDIIFYHGDGRINEMKPSAKAMETIKKRISPYGTAILYIGDGDKTDNEGAVYVGAKYVNAHRIK